MGRLKAFEGSSRPEGHGPSVPRGKYEALNYALGRAVDGLDIRRRLTPPRSLRSSGAHRKQEGLAHGLDGRSEARLDRGKLDLGVLGVEQELGEPQVPAIVEAVSEVHGEQLVLHVPQNGVAGHDPGPGARRV